MKKMLFIAAATGMLISGIIAATTSPETNNPGSGSVSGTIRDAGYDTPVTNATITINDDREIKPDEDGTFSVENLEQGTYLFIFSAPGYETVTEKFYLNENEKKILDIRLSTSVETVDVVTTDVKEEKYMPVPESKTYKSNSNKLSGGIFYNREAIQFGEKDYDEFYMGDYNTESYNVINENNFKEVVSNPLSTFSIDVDNASYSNIRRFISYGQAPPVDAVRIEEMINYFDYTYAAPIGNDPFSINYEMSECPWNENSRLIMIGLQGKDIDYSKASPSNLVFLIDVSGSMASENKLSLVKKSLNHLIRQLNPSDRVALVVYAGAAGLVLPSTPVSKKEEIIAALSKLEAGGSTAGGAGIELAYKVAGENLIKGGNNRVILCTDGDFNIGSSSDAEMTRLIEEKRKSGVFLTICGFGMGNYKDSKMETIANNGNGNYYYIDNIQEAEKVFGTDMRGTLFTIAKDVKIQIEFNPAQVESYRLIGYENRLLNKEDFDNDAKDAGELGAGHRVTALYEIVLRSNAFEPKGMNDKFPGEELKYQSTQIKEDAFVTDEILTLKLRYKEPDGDVSRLIEKPLANTMTPLSKTSDNYRFACAVVEFGMLLRNSEYKGTAKMEEVVKLANSARGADTHGYRSEFIDMVKTYIGVAEK